VEAFVLDKADWILEKQRAIIAHREAKPRLTGEADYARRKAAARHLILKRIKELNRVYGFSYGRISIRNQRSRWGSCSAEGNLSFNYRLVYLPEPLIDYVIVHELCHLKEMNHGVAFWRLLAKSIPDYALRKRDLKAQGLELF
jgi:predicted metal-dependent hydrolase